MTETDQSRASFENNIASSWNRWLASRSSSSISRSEKLGSVLVRSSSRAFTRRAVVLSVGGSSVVRRPSSVVRRRIMTRGPGFLAIWRFAHLSHQPCIRGRMMNTNSHQESKFSSEPVLIISSAVDLYQYCQSE
jgi:hypothetical protein